MRNKMHSEESRAARLVELIRDKVEQNPKSYHMFVNALEADQLANQDILELLKEKFESLSKGEHIVIGFCKCCGMIILCVSTQAQTGSQEQAKPASPPQIQEVVIPTADQSEPKSTATGIYIQCQYPFLSESLYLLISYT